MSELLLQQVVILAHTLVGSTAAEQHRLPDPGLWR
ncbi:rCG37686 [Rattus norvegicus]|uniref:RCG37686 n=1 Tax=Rattus norvegicus TaxID=10116 RepID=A6JEV5_RAT|nr:rCG37686 [Rattus norvegicus]